MRIKSSLFLLFLLSSLCHASPHAMVVSEQRLASQIGVDILRQGGNAIDAAVAVGYALAVVDPCCGNIGGGGFMTIHLADGKNIFLNFRERAPLQASKKMYLDAKGNPIPKITMQGYLAVAVPGTVMGLDTALQHYGTLTRAQVMAPAIRLAEKGFTLTPYAAKLFAENHVFLKNDKPLQAGELFIQSDLAKTLKLISDQGTTAFYHGPIAETIVAANQANGGILTLKDFNDYTVETLKPLHCRYHGYDIYSAPPPSSGGVTLCEILNILAYFPIKNTGYHSAETIQDIVEAMRYGFRDRNLSLGDPDFIHNPVNKLISPTYAKQIATQIKSSFKSSAHQSITSPAEKKDTTHYSVIDAKGNAVSVTYTLNGYFGAKVIADHTGFFLNDEMDDFATKPGVANQFGLVQAETNTIAAGKRPLSSMTPTIVLKNGHLFMVVGSPGGPRIITAVLLTMLNVMDYNMTLQAAVDAPRFHYQGEPDEITAEPAAFTPGTIKQLTQLGYHVKQEKSRTAIAAILMNDQHQLVGTMDHRRPDGAAVGI